MHTPISTYSLQTLQSPSPHSVPSCHCGFGAMDRGEISSGLVQSSIMKRKRSKRQRPLGGGGNSSSSEDGMGDGRPDIVLTTSSSSEDHQLMMVGGSSEEEEEDREVAKCLILLAQGHCQTHVNSHRIGMEMMGSSRIRKPWLDNKKRVNGGGVYECKTCNRSFHSFQALGGHRASHKKLKITADDVTPIVQPALKSSDTGVPPFADLQLGISRGPGKIRVHECVICGAEFASGQALGGHMRRHRVTIAVNSPLEIATRAAATADGITLSLMTSPAHVETEEATSRSNNNEFQCLDLNLPATSSSEDDMGVDKFSFASKQSKQLKDSGLAFSSPAPAPAPGPALVDCHY